MPAPQPPPMKNWPHNFDKYYVFKRLDIIESPMEQQALRTLAQEIYAIVVADAIKQGRNSHNLFRSSSSRNQIQYEWRKRMPRIPVLIRNHVTDTELLSAALYKYLNCIQDELGEEYLAQQNPAAVGQKIVKVANPAAGIAAGAAEVVAGAPALSLTPQQLGARRLAARQLEQEQERPSRFDYRRPYIVPNGDIQIIRADYPNMPIAIRVSDFLTNRGDPTDVCPDGDWVNIANIKFDLFRSNLNKEGYLADGDTAGEVRLTSFNVASTLLRTIREHWPRLRNPSPDPFEGSNRSPLPRPNLTIIIRGANVTGGALSANQPALNRPEQRMGNNAITPNRRTEQANRYAANKHARTKRKRAEAAAGAEAGAETADEADNETDAPAAQRIKVTAKTAAATAAAIDPATAAAPGPGFPPDPALGAVPEGTTWQELEGRDDDDGISGAFLDPALFNEEGLVVGSDGAALDAFFQENQWAETGAEAGEPMEE
ncbi:hypothetical protein PENVUL_c005G05853 [Penicillium vulpinum]|uniref:Uncharacterized protein n=1 Tax=Penicillium vulpinum TaxID=29845 RepID=A0A1V6S7X6_9EURO|nr:hypothetical protein PENVUL_c005G05853 [Penicillium vulpinum]